MITIKIQRVTEYSGSGYEYHPGVTSDHADVSAEIARRGLNDVDIKDATLRAQIDRLIAYAQAIDPVVRMGGYRYCTKLGYEFWKTVPLIAG